MSHTQSWLNSVEYKKKKKQNIVSVRKGFGVVSNTWWGIKKDAGDSNQGVLYKYMKFLK